MAARLFSGGDRGGRGGGGACVQGEMDWIEWKTETRPYVGLGTFCSVVCSHTSCVLCCSFNDIILPLNCCGCVWISCELLIRYIVSLELLFKKKLSAFVILNY